MIIFTVFERSNTNQNKSKNQNKSALYCDLRSIEKGTNSFDQKMGSSLKESSTRMYI